MLVNRWSLAQLQNLSMSLIGAYRDTVPKPNKWRGLHNQACVLWLLEEGSLYVETAKRNKDILPGNWVFQMPGLDINQTFSAQARLISIRFHIRWPSGRPLFRSNEFQCMDEGHYPMLKQSALRYLDCLPEHGYSQDWQKRLHEPDDMWSLQAAQSQFLQHWYRCAHDLGFQPQGEGVEDRRVALALQLLEQRLDRRDVPYQEMENHLSLSRVQLDRLFKQSLGHSPKREHDLLRLAHAQEQLSGPHTAIKQIAAQLGFRDASQFAKWFRRLDGRNPRVARRDGLALV